MYKFTLEYVRKTEYNNGKYTRETEYINDSKEHLIKRRGKK